MALNENAKNLMLTELGTVAVTNETYGGKGNTCPFLGGQYANHWNKH